MMCSERVIYFLSWLGLLILAGSMFALAQGFMEGTFPYRLTMFIGWTSVVVAGILTLFNPGSTIGIYVKIWSGLVAGGCLVIIAILVVVAIIASIRWLIFG